MNETRIYNNLLKYVELEVLTRTPRNHKLDIQIGQLRHPIAKRTSSTVAFNLLAVSNILYLQKTAKKCSVGVHTYKIATII